LNRPAARQGFYYFSVDFTLIQLLNGKNQIPILSPNNIAHIHRKGLKQINVAVLIVLRMWVFN